MLQTAAAGAFDSLLRLCFQKGCSEQVNTPKWKRESGCTLLHAENNRVKAPAYFSV